MRVTGIFTSTTISPGGLLRQCPNHYAIRAGQNLPDKEFRYLRTVIVTAAVYWGFNSMLSHLLLTFQHRAGVSPYTSSFDLAETCVFGKQSLGPFHCGPLSRAPLLPLALGFSPHLPVSVCGTGTLAYLRAFLASEHRGLRYSNFAPFRPGQPTPGFRYFEVSLCLSFGGYGISTVCASPTPLGLSLAPDLPWADEPSPRNLRFSAIMIPT